MMLGKGCAKRCVQQMPSPHSPSHTSHCCGTHMTWVLFRDLPYLAIVMGVDLCMFMSVGVALDKQKTRWRDESLASAAAGASVPRILKGNERGGDGKGATWKELEAPKWAPPGTLSAPSPVPGGTRSAAAQVLLLPQSRQRFAESPHF